MIIPDTTILELRARVLDVFDDLRRSGVALNPTEVRNGLRAATHLTFVHVDEGSSAFIAFGPMRVGVCAEDVVEACAHRAVSCTWEGTGHLVLVSLPNAESEIAL